MALITCPECEKEVSDKAASCPGCGYPFTINNIERGNMYEPNNVKKPKKTKYIVIVSIVILLLYLGLRFILDISDTASRSNTALKEPSFNELKYLASSYLAKANLPCASVTDVSKSSIPDIYYVRCVENRESINSIGYEMNIRTGKVWKP